MNNIKSFSFYRNYYELIKFLNNEERLKMYDAILEYVFEDKEPELKNLLKGIWVNLKMPLDTSKKNIINGQKGGRPKNPNKNLKETQKKPKQEPKTKANNISYFLFLISNFKDKGLLREKIEEWLNYKKERKDKPYTEIGFKKLIKQIENNVEIYGEEAVANLIDLCMANNYQGIIFDKLKNTSTKKITQAPEWFDKDLETQELSEEDKKVFETL